METNKTVTINEAIRLLEKLKKSFEGKFDNTHASYSFYVGLVEMMAAQSLTTNPIKVKDIERIIACNQE